MTFSSPERIFNVAVTGNRPFMEYKWNTSQLVRDALPDFIKTPHDKAIRILKYTRDTCDTYEDVRQVSKDIWRGDSSLFDASSHAGIEPKRYIDVDLILHLGMVALGYPDKFSFETTARRDGYVLPGDDGKQVDSEELKRLGLPETLTTSLDVEAAWLKVKEKFLETPTTVSHDAGLYFCELRLYSSLAQALLTDSLRSKLGRVAFQHIPQDHTSEAIALARDITVAYIIALVDDPLIT